MYVTYDGSDTMDFIFFKILIKEVMEEDAKMGNMYIWKN